MNTLPMPPPTGDPNPKPRKSVVARLALVLAVALGGVVAVQAPAAASWAQCPNGTACMYIDVNGGGNPLIASVGGSGIGVCWNLSPSWNDKISSAYSRFASGSNIRLMLHQHSNCSGSGLSTSITPGEQDNFTGLFELGDAISSFGLVSP